MSFKDRFSGHAAEYAQFRPSYPEALFHYLANLAPDRSCAWDCATGNGQAAIGFAPFFDSVIATDASAKQIAEAEPETGIDYRVATSEKSGLEPASAALITVAQALHWFDCAAFFAEAQRVLKKSGVLAVWSYNLFKISPAIDGLVEEFYRETIGAYWDFERTLVETGYHTIEFPFSKIALPEFRMQAEWTLGQVIGYLRTWSATKNFIAARGFDPVTELTENVNGFWGEPDMQRTVTWPLSVIARRKG